MSIVRNIDRLITNIVLKCKAEKEVSEIAIVLEQLNKTAIYTIS